MSGCLLFKVLFYCYFMLWYLAENSWPFTVVHVIVNINLVMSPANIYIQYIVKSEIGIIYEENNRQLLFSVYRKS